MNRATPKMRDLAERIIAHEAKGTTTSETNTPAAHAVCEKLRSHLATLMGNTGVRALLLHALALATVEVSWLGAVQIKSDGSLEGFEGIDMRDGSKKMVEGGVVLLAQVLGLLVVFIGENLTVRTVRDVWPKLALNDSVSSTGVKK
jgi:hypothetical protein